MCVSNAERIAGAPPNGSINIPPKVITVPITAGEVTNTEALTTPGSVGVGGGNPAFMPPKVVIPATGLTEPGTPA
jgi:hypothetical protein